MGTSNPPTTGLVWRKGQRRPRPDTWVYYLLTDWRSRFISFEEKGRAYVDNGEMWATLTRDCDTGDIIPSIGIVADTGQHERALDEAKQNMAVSRATYLLSPARELLAIIAILEERYPGWHNDRTRIPNDAWAVLSRTERGISTLLYDLLGPDPMFDPDT